MFLCVESALLSIQAVKIADIVLPARASHLDIRGTTGSGRHTFDRRRHLAMLVVR